MGFDLAKYVLHILQCNLMQLEYIYKETIVEMTTKQCDYSNCIPAYLKIEAVDHMDHGWNNTN